MARFRFDRFEFDSATGDLQTAGRRVRLRPQPARALEHLLKRPGELVTRTELQRAIWPEGTFVHFDDGLDSCIKQIRAALGGRASSHLETLVRRGFRFTAPVTMVSGLRALPVLSAGESKTAAHRVAKLVEEIVAHVTGGVCTAGVSVLDDNLAGPDAGSDAEPPIRFLLSVTVRGGAERGLSRRNPIDGIDHTRDHHFRSS